MDTFEYGEINLNSSKDICNSFLKVFKYSYFSEEDLNDDKEKNDSCFSSCGIF